MRISPQLIANYLQPMKPVRVVRADFSCLNSAMPYTHALALVERGEVEAVVTKAGKVRYLRVLAPVPQRGA